MDNFSPIMTLICFTFTVRWKKPRCSCGACEAGGIGNAESHKLDQTRAKLDRGWMLVDVVITCGAHCVHALVAG